MFVTEQALMVWPWQVSNGLLCVKSFQQVILQFNYLKIPIVLVSPFNPFILYISTEVEGFNEKQIQFVLILLESEIWKPLLLH